MVTTILLQNLMTGNYVYVFNCESTTQALKIERHIKRMKSSTYIINLTRYPEMIEKLKRQYLDKI